MVEICNLFMVLVIACLPFAKDTMKVHQIMPVDHQFNIQLRDDAHIDESTNLGNAGLTVYMWVEIQTQARQL